MKVFFLYTGQFCLESSVNLWRDKIAQTFQNVLKLISSYNFRVPRAAGTADGFPQDQTLGIASTKSPCLCSKCPVKCQESKWDNHFRTHQNIPHSWINQKKKSRKKRRHLTAIDALLWCSINIIISSRSVGSGIAKKMPEHWGMWCTTFPMLWHPFKSPFCHSILLLHRYSGPSFERPL